MAFTPDRLKAAFFALFRSSVPRLDYYGKYVARVVKESRDGTVDIQPSDPRIPPMAKVPLWHGLPGAEVIVPSGTMVFVGWSGGDPSDPHAELFPNSGPAIQITLKADKIYLAGKPIAEGGELVDVMDGVVHGQGVDPFTGAPYFALGNTSKVVAVKR